MTRSTVALGLVFTLLLAVATAASASAASVTMSLGPNLLGNSIAAASPVAINQSCARPDAAAAIDPYFATPPFALVETSGDQGSADVQIALSANGALQSASILRASGDFGIDQGALLTAKSAHYAPEMRGCQNVAGVYTLTVTFN